jgi:4-hydroxybenzoate polyprenyltransferase/phosphoserine phosphatase
MVSKAQKPILFVDLDESLIKTDIFREQFIRSLAIAPWKTIRILFREKFQPERVKAAVAEIISTDPSTLPYNQEVLTLIHQAKKEKRKVVLATATYEKVAHSIAKHLGIFDAVLATTPTFNCKGRKKLKVMKEYAGGQPFDYVGDSRADYPIFAECRTAYIVGSLRYLPPHKVIARSSILPSFLKAIRPHQWAKNGLIFLPLLTSHQITLTSLRVSFFGFICFSMAASAIYIINDMVDVEDDRHQLKKKDRPFAKGNLTIDEGVWLSTILLICSIVLSSIWLPAGLWVLASYIILTFLYSFSLKALPMVDVFCLSALYAIRVLYGQIINTIESSSWLLAFCVFFFLSLAFMKRSAEIEKTQRKQQPLTTRRGYKLDDNVLLQTSGICSGLLSILVLMLYINSAQVIKLYMHPEYLWGAAYVLLYWKLRLWLITARGQMDHDPVLFAIKDPTSYAITSMVILFGLLAKGLF